MEEKVTIINPNGEEQEVFLITILSLEKYHSVYLVYTEKELNYGNNEIKFAKMNEEDDNMYLENIESEEEFNDLKEQFSKEATQNASV